MEADPQKHPLYGWRYCGTRGESGGESRLNTLPELSEPFAANGSAQDFLLSAPADFSFQETLQAHGWRQLLPFVWEEANSTLQGTEPFSGNRVVLMTLSPAENAVRVTCSALVDHGEILGKVRRMLQWDTDLTAFHAFCAARPELCHLPRERKGRMLCSPTVYEDVCKTILTTNTTWAQTIAMNARLVGEFGSPLPEDPSRHAFPAPMQIAAVPFEEFARRARLGYRAGSIHSLSAAVTRGDLNLDALLDPELDAQSVWKQLLGLQGVGPYAAACLMLYLGRPGCVNIDSWARMLLSKELGRPVTNKEVEAYFAPYGDWQGLVYSFYPWKQEGAPLTAAEA